MAYSKKEKTQAAVLARKMAKYIRRNGFTPAFNDLEQPDCGCFIHALFAVANRHNRNRKTYQTVLKTVIRVTGADNLGELALVDAGWKKGATRDAAAACNIAADLLEAESN